MDTSQKVDHPAMGIIRLDYCYPPALGDIDHSGSFDFDVYYRVVPGLTFKMCQDGKLEGKVKQRFEEAVKWLIGKGVKVITGDCGFMMYYQMTARAIVGTKMPVVMSSICQLPSIACAFNNDQEIIIMTANGPNLLKMTQHIINEYKVDLHDRHYRIVGCEHVNGFEAVANGTEVDVTKVEKGVVKLAKEKLKEFPNVVAFLFECTELPAYSDAVRAETGLPVYDAITCCTAIMKGYLDNKRFGRNNWQQNWDKKQDDYKFGDNLSEEEKKELVSQKS